ncbi:MgtC/SapB family protein [Pseudogracilibacillus sp. SE30717A]|uniref:MgtC/SapB family protein n=1 Tax=Pseudogracilibacillus sp. SE30717A TaxID=3098293 RepID=UPI00300DF999
MSDFSIVSYLDQNAEYLIRVLLSAVLGFLIGLDREYKKKPAGVKTYMYVTVACTLLTIISVESVEKYGELNHLVRMDPLRLAAQIVSGLGFLGAGVILKDGLEIRGLTSAAMILFAGGVGIGIGAGFYGIIIFTMLIAWCLAKLGEKLERDYNLGNRRKRKRSIQKRETS